MSAEFGTGFPSSLEVEFCFLDFTFEALRLVSLNTELTQAVRNLGFDGEAFLKSLNSILETQAEDADFEPSDLSEDPEMRKIWSHKIPWHLAFKITVYVEGVYMAEAKQEENIFH